MTKHVELPRSVNTHSYFMPAKARQKGQAFPEYVVGVIVLIAIFFTDVPVLDDRSIAEALTDEFKNNYQGYEYVMSQPATDPLLDDDDD